MSIDKTLILGKELDSSSKVSSSASKSDYIEIEPGAMLASRYKIISKLGEGGMGVVYQGLDTQLNRSVAIKLLKRKVAEDKQAIENLKQEAQVSMILTHPHIMRLINFEHHGQYAFLLMEYVDGMDLKTIARKMGGKLDPRTVANIMFKLCSALEYAHKNNVIHRDIKPANIMISSKKEVKLMDFGIAKILLAGSNERPQLAGTLAYLAPELVEGAKPDARCDIYALGLTMYELLAGEHPYRGLNAQQMVKAHLGTPLQPIEGLEKDLSNIISRCVEKKPNARFQTVGDLRGALAIYLGLDESHKVSRMKASMEHEKRKLEIEQRKVAEKLAMLESEITRMENRPASMADQTSPGFSLFGFSKEGVRIQFPLALIAISAAGGVGGAIIGEMTRKGALYHTGSAETNMALAMGFMGMFALMPPAVFKYGANEWFRSAAIGVVAGLSCFYLWIHSYTGGLMLGNVSHYAMFGLALSLGAVMCEPEGADIHRIIKMAPVVILAMGLSAVASIAHMALLFRFTPETDNLFYLPLMAAVIWATLDVREQRV